MPVVGTAKGATKALHTHGGFLQGNSKREGGHAE